ncbi:class I SAM-dependent methyltransferase [Streptomyces sp. LP05-1]|uniref:Class I SAM-dependent methyltransferase n=1 Tax=Streptomyces pyxinae TaxID=2970734 RepID=A0ABT2CN89_9ACTN|nr:class I SAM-dependent methyltransferase [Streptomyces sp. LP05-1]MCS0638893.1 class I SAM-dependent methyltransferase [Streptomyces sp. LP05-1]
MERQKFDGLAEEYERHRPRYPEALVREIARRVPRHGRRRVVDAGAGTGIALEGLVPLLGPECRYEAVDVSGDMVAAGRAKFPGVTWTVGAAEPYLEGSADIDLVVVAQAYQWMDRPRFRRAARRCLRPGGVPAVMRERPGPTVESVHGRLRELAGGVWSGLPPGLPGVRRRRRAERRVPTGRRGGGDAHGRLDAADGGDFLGFARSSTQVRRGLAAHGEAMTGRPADLVGAHAENGGLGIAYRCRLFLAVR